MRQTLGGGLVLRRTRAVSFSSVLLSGMGVAEVRKIFEYMKHIPPERQFVVKETPRDGAAVLHMQVRHDIAGDNVPTWTCAPSMFGMKATARWTAEVG